MTERRAAPGRDSSSSPDLGEQRVERETETESITAWLAHNGAGLTKIDYSLTSCRSLAGLDSLQGTMETGNAGLKGPVLKSWRPQELCRRLPGDW